METITLHASCVAVDGRAVLLMGPAGVGKSDVALRLIDQGAILVADDQTKLFLSEGCLVATAPPTIEGMIEIRHIGLVALPCCGEIPVGLCVTLVGPDTALERLPEPCFQEFLGHPVRTIKLLGLAASTPAKIRLALRIVTEGGSFLNE